MMIKEIMATKAIIRIRLIEIIPVLDDELALGGFVMVIVPVSGTIIGSG